MTKTLMPSSAALIAQTNAAPILTFDYKSPFARCFLLAALAWPEDREQQSYALVTFALQLRAFLNKKGPRIIAEEEFRASVIDVARQLGVSPSAVLSMPIAEEIAQGIARDVGNAAGRIETEMYYPAGGDQAAADAPGSRVLREGIERAVNGPVKHVGYQLFLMARMSKLHPEMGSSLNRTKEIMVQTCKGPTWPNISYTTLNDHWVNWRSISPLAAAIWAWNLQCPASVRSEDWMVRAFTTQDGLKSVMQWTRWFRRFATNFKAKGSKTSLLDASATIDFGVNLPEQMPPLPKLLPEEVAAGLSYKAATTKYF